MRAEEKKGSAREREGGRAQQSNYPKSRLHHRPISTSLFLSSLLQSSSVPLSSPLSKVLFNLLYWHSESSQCGAAAEIVTLQWRLHWSASYTPAAEPQRDESSSSLFCCSLPLSLSPMPSCARFQWSYRLSLSLSLVPSSCVLCVSSGS